MEEDYLKITDRVMTIQKYVRKTNICGGRVADVVDSKKDLTQYFLETFEDGELIYVQDEQAIFRVKSRPIMVYKSDLPKLKEQERKEREQLIERNRKKRSKERDER